MDFLLTFIGKSGLDPASAAMLIRTITSTMHAELAAGEEIALPGIGTFRLIDRAARPGRNLRTGEAVTIAAHKAVKFLPSKTLKEKVN